MEYIQDRTFKWLSLSASKSRQWPRNTNYHRNMHRTLRDLNDRLQRFNLTSSNVKLPLPAENSEEPILFRELLEELDCDCEAPRKRGLRIDSNRGTKRSLSMNSQSCRKTWIWILIFKRGKRNRKTCTPNALLAKLKSEKGIASVLLDGVEQHIFYSKSICISGKIQHVPCPNGIHP